MYLVSLGLAIKSSRRLDTSKPGNSNHNNANEHENHGNSHENASVEQLVFLEDGSVDVVGCSLFESASLGMLETARSHAYGRLGVSGGGDDCYCYVHSNDKKKGGKSALTNGAFAALDVRITA
jgi:hypothetical protein